MSKLIGDPSQVVPDLVAALVRSDRRLTRIDGLNVVLRADPLQTKSAGRVALISGGGSGHEPAHAGYVGAGMLTAAVLGEVFTSPSVDTVLGAIRAVTGDAGCLLIVKNYTGDRLNFGLAAQLARAEGIAVEVVLVDDDAAIGVGSRVGARGLAGTVLVHKVAGAAASAGATLEEVKALAERTIASLSTMGVALSSCTMPGEMVANFKLAPGEVEFGLGIHGEPGVSREAIAPVDEIVSRLIDRIIAAGRVDVARGRVVVLVNGLGGTPAMELITVAGSALAKLEALGMYVDRLAVGEFLGAMDMAGCSISLLQANDELLTLLDAPTDAPAWTGLTIPGATPSIAARGGGAELNQRGPQTDSAASERFSAGVRAAITCLMSSEEELTALDREVGDGDLGISMRRGSEAIEAHFSEIVFDHPQAALRTLAAIIRESMGGTSGPLMAAFLLGASRAIGREARPAETPSIARAFHAGCTSIAELGGARLGDRTMLDALWPAAEALDGAAEGPAAEAIRKAALAAAKGAEGTCQIQAAVGRSSYLGDRVIGHPDPGARAAALWLGAIAESLEAVS